MSLFSRVSMIASPDRRGRSLGAGGGGAGGGGGGGAGVSPNVVSWDSAGNSGSTATQSVTPTGGRRGIYVWVCHDVDGDTFSVAFNTSESFTEIATETPTSAGLRLFRLLAPTATTADVVVTRETGSGDFMAIVLVVSDLNQATPERDTDAARATGGASSVKCFLAASVHDLVVDALSQNGTGAVTQDAGQTPQVDATRSSERRAASSVDSPSSFQTTLGWDVANNAAQIAVSLIGDDGTLSVATLSRDIGSAAGGPTMTITGTGFSGSPTVNFGGNAATGVTVVSSTEITCTIPAGTGTVTVSVDGVDGPEFEYLPAPTAHLNKLANFENDTFGDFSTTVSAGNSVTITTDAGNGPEGSDKFARCTADTVSGGANAYVNADDGGNTPHHGSDGYWMSWWIRVEDATTALLDAGQIKLTLYRGGGTPRWHNEGMGPQHSAGGGEVTASDDSGGSGGLWDGASGSADRPLLTTLGTAEGWVRIDRHWSYDSGAAEGTARIFVDGKFVVQDTSPDVGNTGSGTYKQEAGIAFHQQTSSGDLVVDVGGVAIGDGYVENISGA